MSVAWRRILFTSPDKEQIMKLTRSLRWKHVIIAVPLCVFVSMNLSTHTSLKTDNASSDDLPAISSASSTTTTTSVSGNSSEPCQPEHPCIYADKVDLRIIIITYKRPSSLVKLFQSLDTLELDEHSAAIEIWIDRNSKTGAVDQHTVKVAEEFQWSGGPSRVHVHSAHVGIYGQWIDTWRPRDVTDDELALFVEDDLTVSKYAYRWIRAVFKAYSEREDFAGASLTSHQMNALSARPKRRLAGPNNHTVVMYKGFGTWGFTPKPLHWKNFQDWYHTHKPSVLPSFHPYVPGALPTSWYRIFESSGRARNMWSQWFIYYMYENKLYSVYSNLAAYTGNKQSSLVVNRFEAGLHYSHSKTVDVSRLLTEWKDEYAVCPVDITRLNWDASYVASDQRY